MNYTVKQYFSIITPFWNAFKFLFTYLHSSSYTLQSLQLTVPKVAGCYTNCNYSIYPPTAPFFFLQCGAIFLQTSAAHWNWSSRCSFPTSQLRLSLNNRQKPDLEGETGLQAPSPPLNAVTTRWKPGWLPWELRSLAAQRPQQPSFFGKDNHCCLLLGRHFPYVLAWLLQEE